MWTHLMSRITWVAIVLVAAVTAFAVTVLTAEHGNQHYRFLETPVSVKTSKLAPAPSELDLSNHTTIPVTDKTPVRTIPITRPEPAVVALPPPAEPEVIVERVLVGHQHHGRGGCKHGGVKVDTGKAPGKTWHCEYSHR